MPQDKTLCEACQATGLAVHVALYRPAPKAAQPAAPGWANAASVTGVPLGPEHHYVLRNPRAGYIYAFFSKNARGRSRWQAWAVSEAGQLYPLADPRWVIGPALADAQCARSGHSPMRLHHLVIERPELCGTTWVFFSDRHLSDATLARYARDEALRDARMQRIEPAQIIASDSPQGDSYTAASAAAIEAILEYAPAFDPSTLPFDAPPRRITEPGTGRHVEARLRGMSTRHRLDLRQDRAAHAARLLARRSARPGGREHPGIVLALWDGVGCALELGGFRNDVAGRIAQYQQECSLEIGAAHAIEGLQRALQHRIDAGYDERAAGAARVPDAEENGMRQRAVMRHAAHDPAALGRPLAALDAQFETGQITEADYKARRSVVIRTHCADPAAMEAEYARIDEYRRRLAATRARQQAHNKADGFAREWPKYGERIDHAALERFKREYEAFGQRAQALLDARTAPLVAWLEAPLFIAALEDYDPADPDDGLQFEDLVGDLLLGIGTSPRGAERIEAWAREMKITRSNLVWRAMARNQTAYEAAINEALAQAESGAGVLLTAESWAHTAEQIKWNKLADLYRKGQSWANTNAKARQPGSSMKVVSMGGLDKLLVSVGDVICRGTFARRVDSVIGEKVVQSLFLLRAGAHLDDVLALVREQALRENVDRHAMIRRMQAAEAFANVLEDDTGRLRPHAQVLREKWQKLADNADKADAMGRFNAAKDARLAAVVALLEAVNLAKSGFDASVKTDAKSLVVLASGVASLAAVSTDVYANVVKGALEEGSHTFQRLKFIGGALGGAASMGAMLSAWIDAHTYKAAGHDDLYSLAMANFWLTAGAGAANTLTALSYCGPWLSEVAERQARRGLATVVVTRGAATVAARVALYRAVAMAAGTTLNIAALGIQCLIWYVSDNELQAWCANCAFGLDREEAWTAEKQRAELFDALRATGMHR